MAACALTLLAKSPGRQFVDISAEEEAARRRCVGSFDEYSGVMREFDCFDIYIIDKLEAVMQNDLSLERHYADAHEIHAFLAEVDVRLAVIDVDMHGGDGCSIAVLPDMARCTPDELPMAAVDACFVHSQRPDHYDSVVGVGQEVWAMPAEKCSAISKAIASWSDLPAVRGAV